MLLGTVSCSVSCSVKKKKVLIWVSVVFNLLAIQGHFSNAVLSSCLLKLAEQLKYLCVVSVDLMIYTKMSVSLGRKKLPILSWICTLIGALETEKF